MAGQENKVASEIRSMIVRGIIDKHVAEILVPTKSVVKVKKGQKIQEAQKLFPGYVFVNADLSGETYNLINSIPKVMGFLGGKNNPQPVTDLKMQKVLSSSSMIPDSKNIMFEIGETLNVIEGPFESFSGVVEDFDIEKQKVKISVLIFGRATSVELSINQVEKVS
jgi:transcriptional antiterminator NusG